MTQRVRISARTAMLRHWTGAGQLIDNQRLSIVRKRTARVIGDGWASGRGGGTGIAGAAPASIVQILDSRMSQGDNARPTLDGRRKYMQAQHLGRIRYLMLHAGKGGRAQNLPYFTGTRVDTGVESWGGQLDHAKEGRSVPNRALTGECDILRVGGGLGSDFEGPGQGLSPNRPTPFRALG